jgi:teichuronic acid biosynthesis glycosyltransferase TuaG
MIASQPMISIIIPTYNHAKFLREALNSVLAQTFTDWEAIVVNNFSEDDTVDVVNSFSDARIRLVNFRNNGVIAASRNEGIRLANAELIAFLDSDDMWFAEKLARCVEELTFGIDLVGHGLRYIKNNDFCKNVRTGSDKAATFNKLLFGANCITTSAVVVRKSWLLKVGGFDESHDLITGEDYDLWLKLSKAGAKFHFVDDILGEYRLHGSNASKNILRQMEVTMAVVNKHFASAEKDTFIIRLNIRRRRAMIFYDFARAMQKNGQKSEALELFWKSAKTYPFRLRTYIAMGLNILPIYTKK